MFKMFNHVFVVLLGLGLFNFIYSDFVDARSRQKRCIVIQKQSGTHGDSSEGDDGGDDEYRKPLPKEPQPDRLRQPYNNRNKGHDVEDVSPELLKYKILPMRPQNEYRLRNRLFRKFLS